MARTDGGESGEIQESAISVAEFRRAVENINNLQDTVQRLTADKDTSAAEAQQQLAIATSALEEERRITEIAAKSLADNAILAENQRQQLEVDLQAEKTTTEANTREISDLRATIDQMRADQQSLIESILPEGNITEPSQTGKDKAVQSVPKATPVVDLTDEKSAVLTKEGVLKIFQEQTLEKQYSMAKNELGYTAKLNLQQVHRNPLSAEIMQTERPLKFSQPTFDSFDGMGDPYEHIMSFTQKLVMWSENQNLMAKLFPASLKQSTLNWFYSLPQHSITYWDELMNKFSHIGMSS